MEFIDLHAQYIVLKEKIDRRISTVLNHGKFIMGPEVFEFEEKLAAFVGRKHCISCASGTDAMQLIYMAYGIGEGDAVFCPDVTFIASVEPACMLGAAPVFCDITEDTYNVCPSSVEKQILAVLAEGKLRPRVIVAVDFLGNPADYDALEILAQKYGLLLIEDAAQSMGASYHGRRCGALGDIAATSFFPAKPLGCYGDGGAVFTDNDEMAELIRSLCVHGKGPGGKYDNVRVGLNSRLDTLQAAILIPKLEALEQYETEARQTAADKYNEAFSGKFLTPYVAQDCVSSYAQYALLAKDTSQRKDSMSALDAEGIPNMIYYPTPQHRLPVFQEANCYGEAFINAESYCARTFSLPMHPYIVGSQDVQIQALNSID